MSGPVVSYHISLKMAEGFNAIRKTACRSLSQDYQQVHPARLQVHLQHRYSRTQYVQPAITRSQSTSGPKLGDQVRESKEIKNINKDEDIDRAQGDLLRDLPEWLEEFTGNLVDERVPSSRDTPASSSREGHPELVREVVSGKHRIYNHFPKDPSCEVCERTKITRALAETRWRSLTLSGKMGDLITADHKILSEVCESRNNHRYAVVVQDWQLNVFNRIRAKQNLHRKRRGVCRKFREPSKKQKVIYTDNSLDFGKACEESSWNHHT